MYNCLDVVCLREQIERRKRLDEVTTRNELLQIARERCGIAGDVTNTRGSKTKNASDHIRLSILEFKHSCSLICS